MFFRIVSCLSLLFFASCKEKSTQKKTIIKDTIAQYIYDVKFNPLSASYIKNKEHFIEHFFDTKINDKEFSGSFLVAKNGQVLYENYTGFSNYITKDLINKNTPLHLASVSKVLTAQAILMLVKDEKLTLDQTFKSLFPEFPHEKTTIRMLLNHRSGLAHYGYFADQKENWDNQKILTNKDILNILATKDIPLEYEIDKKFSYCNTNYALLALAIEKVTGKNFPEAMKNLVFEPLKMNNTFVLNIEDKDKVSQSYKGTKQPIPWDFLDAIYGDKNVYSTPHDLLKLDLATYSPNYLTAELKTEMLKGYSYERKGIRNYGLGIRMNEFDNGNTIHYHNGWWHGSTTSFTTLKKDTVTIIALSNKYTRKVYQSIALSSLFGDYPYDLEE
uniref:serine hydrolase domain-containing protein n=1 Tax=Flavobacterium sp. TaxID=239 RepID=UPI00404A441A